MTHFLYELYDLITKGEKEIKDEDDGFEFSKENGLWSIAGEVEAIEIPESDFKKTIQITADMYEPMLPNGTIVDLKKDKMSENMRATSADNVRLIVPHRCSTIILPIRRVSVSVWNPDRSPTAILYSELD